MCQIFGAISFNLTKICDRHFLSTRIEITKKSPGQDILTRMIALVDFFEVINSQVIFVLRKTSSSP